MSALHEFKISDRKSAMVNLEYVVYVARHDVDGMDAGETTLYLAGGFEIAIHERYDDVVQILRAAKTSHH
jgi:hypothetical protein